MKKPLHSNCLSKLMARISLKRVTWEHIFTTKRDFHKKVGGCGNKLGRFGKKLGKFGKKLGCLEKSWEGGWAGWEVGQSSGEI